MELFAVYNGELSDYQNHLTDSEKNQTYTTLTVIFDKDVREVKEDEIDKFVLAEVNIEDIEFIKPLDNIRFEDSGGIFYEVLLSRVIITDFSETYLVLKTKNTKGSYDFKDKVSVDSYRLKREDVLELLPNNDFQQVNCSSSRIRPLCKD